MSHHEADRPMVVEDAFGRGCQYLPETVAYLDDEGTPYPHVLEGGWWNLSMTVRIDPEQIAFPVKVVWS